MINKNIKIGIVGDGLQATTGFGIVGKKILEGLNNFGYNNIFAIALSQLPGLIYDDDPIPSYRPSSNLDKQFLGYVIGQEKPDVLIFNYEATYVFKWIDMLNDIKQDYRPKVIAYVPIEGWPLSELLIKIAERADATATYMKFGADLYTQETNKELLYAGFGPEHGNFKKFTLEDKQYYRSMIGWDNKFVIGFVGRNKRTKQQGQMLRLARCLVDHYGMDDLLMYLHCAVRDNLGGASWDGWDLGAWIGAYELEPYVCLPLMPSQTDSPITYDEDNAEFIATINKEVEKGELSNKEGILSRLYAYNLTQLYNCMDVYVSMSQGEGFGIPQLEAMACGIPIIYMDDSGGSNELIGDAGISIPPISYEPWRAGIELPIPDVNAFAWTINSLKKNPSKLAEMSEKSLKRSTCFSWSDMQNLMDDMILKVMK